MSGRRSWVWSVALGVVGAVVVVIVAIVRGAELSWVLVAVVAFIAVKPVASWLGNRKAREAGRALRDRSGR